MKIRNSTTSAIRDAKSVYEHNLALDIKNNPKNSVHMFTVPLKSSSAFLCYTNLMEEDSEVASLLNDYFCSVYTKENLSIIPTPNLRLHDDLLSNITVTHKEVFHQLCKLHPHKSCGPDQYHPYVLHAISDSLVVPLTLLYNKSLNQGIIPGTWKEATVIAIHNKGSKQQTCNYRPISLTSVICKMLEAIIKQHIMNHLLTHNLLSDYQHGFRFGRLCETQLLRVMNAWMESLESNQ